IRDGESGCDEPTVVLRDDRTGAGAVADRGGDDPVAAEARVEAAVGVVTDERELSVLAVTGAGRDELAVRLRHDGVRPIAERAVAESCGHDPAGAEAR